MYNSKAKFIKHIACEQCGSSDANSLYEDGNQYCFSCENFIPGRNEMIQNNVTKAPIQGVINNVFTKGEYSALQGRGIKQEVCRKFGVTVTDKNNKHIYPYYDQDKNHIGNKIRKVDEKKFSGIVKSIPDREDILPDINENLIVEFYSK